MSQRGKNNKNFLKRKSSDLVRMRLYYRVDQWKTKNPNYFPCSNANRLKLYRDFWNEHGIEMLKKDPNEIKAYFITKFTEDIECDGERRIAQEYIIDNARDGMTREFYYKYIPRHRAGNNKSSFGRKKYKPRLRSQRKPLTSTTTTTQPTDAPCEMVFFSIPILLERRVPHSSLFSLLTNKSS